MLYKNFKDTSLSCLGMGNMRLPIKQGGSDKDIDYEKAQEIIDYAMEHGINYFDSAYVYHSGESERFVGQALKKYDRDSYFITTKYLLGANPDYKATFEEQLKRYDREKIDFYLIHAIGDQNADTYLTNGCIEYFLEQKRLGKISYLGFSSHSSPETLRKFASHHEWDFAQIQLNYYDYLYGTAKEEYDILKELGIPVVVMESVRGGRLSSLPPKAEEILRNTHPDWTISSWAFRWLKKLDNVIVSLSGMSNLEQIKDNVNTYSDDRALTDEEEELVFKAARMLHDELVVPCTECRYCIDTCPAQINIPGMLKVYNRFKLEGPWALGALKEVTSKGKPEDCVNCGNCTEHCPQSIKIPDLLAELAK